MFDNSYHLRIVIIYKSVVHVANSMPKVSKFLYAIRMPSFYKIAVRLKVNVLILVVGVEVNTSYNRIQDVLTNLIIFQKVDIR